MGSVGVAGLAMFWFYRGNGREAYDRDGRADLHVLEMNDMTETLSIVSRPTACPWLPLEREMTCRT